MEQSGNGQPAGMEFPCMTPACQEKERKVRRSKPSASILNNADVSILVYAHEDPMRCKYCNQVYQIRLVTVTSPKADWQLLPIAEKPTESRIVIPDNNTMTKVLTDVILNPK